MMDYKSGEEFVDKLYNNLINSEEVKNAINKSNQKPSNREEMLKIYFERLEKSHDISNDRKIHLLKLFYYNKYVIKELPESYIELQKRIAREEGYGDIEITDDMKQQLLEEVVENQKKSLDSWVDYLTSDDAMYPMWFKYYAFQGMIKLGSFNKEKMKFNKRSKDTVSDFVELNSEFLAQIYNILSNTIGEGTLNEEQLNILSNGESFAKMYSYFVSSRFNNEVSKNNTTNGIWVKYEQGDNYQRLWESLQGKNTGWCTAGKETCKIQLKHGDFYVYYTYDEKNISNNPRIAIRMNGKNQIGEIRGIAKDQNLEPSMLEIISEKLEEFPDKDEYLKKEHDMKLLTLIESKNNNNEELTYEEFRFLYEIDETITGFGWEKDPRVNQIKKTRNVAEDFKYYFGEKNLAFSFEDISSNTKIIITENRNLSFKIDKDLDIIADLVKIKVALSKSASAELDEKEFELIYGLKKLSYYPFGNKVISYIEKYINSRDIRKDISKYYNCPINNVAVECSQANGQTDYYFNKKNMNIYTFDQEIKKLLIKYKNIIRNIEENDELSLEDINYCKEYIPKHLWHVKDIIDYNRARIKPYIEYYNIAKRYGYTLKNIALSLDDFDKGNDIYIYIGDLNIQDEVLDEKYHKLQYVYGSASFPNLKIVKGLSNLKVVKGDLKLSKMEDIGDLNQGIVVENIFLPDDYYESDNVAKVRTNSRFEKYLLENSENDYMKGDNKVRKALVYGSEKDLKKVIDKQLSADAKYNEFVDESTNPYDQKQNSLYNKLDDLLRFYKKYERWPDYKENPFTSEDFESNDLYDYYQELLENEGLLPDDIESALLEVDENFFESYIY